MGWESEYIGCPLKRFGYPNVDVLWTDFILMLIRSLRHVSRVPVNLLWVLTLKIHKIFKGHIKRGKQIILKQLTIKTIHFIFNWFEFLNSWCWTINCGMLHSKTPWKSSLLYKKISFWTANLIVKALFGGK